MSSKRATAFILAASEFQSHDVFCEYLRHKKLKQPLTECALPGCNKMAIHNGGYCCADHCKKHRNGGKGAERR